MLTPTSHHLVRSVEEVTDQDVNHWIEASLAAESLEHAGPAMTFR
uniref:Polyketide synthase n=1 Tax=Peronospora matthiolae TaxID=2874970 RepID=A0AAV1VM02_9STRA